jgi:hypothetical protein
MSKECFNCKKQIPIEEFSKHELECNSTFYKNELENLIPCEKCNTLILFEEYNNHLNLCGLETPIFYLPMNNTETQNSADLLINNINLLIQNNTNIINYLNTINSETDTYEQLSELDADKVIQGIDLDKISKIKELEEEMDCPICFDKCNKIVNLTCKHKICLDCAEEWFQENVKCPICNIDFTEI